MKAAAIAPTNPTKPPNSAKPAVAAAQASTARKTRQPTAKNARERLQSIAARLFRELGYAGTSIRAIAKRARVEPSALYYHFPSKEALLDAVLDESILRVHDAVRQAVAALPADAKPRERILAAIAAHAPGTASTRIPASAAARTSR